MRADITKPPDTFDNVPSQWHDTYDTSFFRRWLPYLVKRTIRARHGRHRWRGRRKQSTSRDKLQGLRCGCMLSCLLSPRYSGERHLLISAVRGRQCRNSEVAREFGARRRRRTVFNHKDWGASMHLRGFEPV